MRLPPMSISGEAATMTLRMLRNVWLFATAALFAAVGQVEAGRDKQVRFAGIHNVPRPQGGGLCYIEVPHVHIYGPDVAVQYRQHDGQNVFVGDPVAYGWDGERHPYFGHHPIRVDILLGDDEPDEEYCYINGPHYHSFAPPPVILADFKVEADAYFYVGTPPPVYVEARPALIKINAVYEPIVYTRPVITVEPPQGWIGIRYAVQPVRAVVVPPPPRRGSAVVGVGVYVPAIEIRPPSIEIGIGVGIGVGVVGGGRVEHGRYKKHKKHKGNRR
jgi:hypothetical protein